MQMWSPTQHAISVISLVRDVMRNLSGSLGHGEFYIVIIYVPERTYIFLNLKGLKHQ